MSTELSSNMLKVLEKIIGQIDKRIVDDMSIDDLFKIDSEVAEVNSVFQTLLETKINELNISLPELKTQLETLVSDIQTKLDNNELKGEKGYTPVKGTDYHDGVDGVSITKIENKDNRLVITDSNGKEYDLGNFTNDYENLLNKPSIPLTIDDLSSCEVGTWIPLVDVDVPFSYTAEYVKIGSLVHIRLIFKLASNSSSNLINGLPFVPKGVVKLSSIVSLAPFLGLSSTSIAFVADGSTSISVHKDNSLSLPDPLLANKTYRFVCTYSV